jgi:hypothetical protein
MAAERFEVLYGTDLVAEDIKVEVTDPNGIEPKLIIRENDPWRVTAKWTMSGSFSNLLQGHFVVHTHVESMGDGNEIHVGPIVKVAAKMTNPADYEAVINVDGGKLSIPGPDEFSAAYKVVTLVTYEWSDGKPSAMAGYNEGPILQVYKDKP